MNSDRDLPCNFLEYLEGRLEQQADAAVSLLGDWLASYTPLRKRTTDARGERAAAAENCGLSTNAA